MAPPARTNPREVVALTVVGACFLFFWDSWVLWPAKIGVVFLHELSHALMTWATGGSVVDAGLWIDQSGHVVSQGGNTFLILNAGYLGSLVWGVLLLGLFRRGRLGDRRPFFAFVMRAFGLFSVLYAFFDVADDVVFRSGQSDASSLAALTGIPAIVWGLGWMGVGAWVVWRARRWIA